MQDKAKEKMFFDNFSKNREYDVLSSASYDVIAGHFNRLVSNNFNGGARLIDLGCGTGAFTNTLMPKIKADFFALDISLNSVMKARSSMVDKIHFMVGDIENLGLKEGSFDIVLFSGVLHHFKELKRSLRESFRILKKGGRLFSYDPNMMNPAMWFYRHPSSPFFSELGKTENERLFACAELKKAINDAGFGNALAYGVSGITFKYVESNIGRMLLPVYNFFDVLLGYSPLARKFGSFIIGYGEK